MARISPVRGSSATAAPARPSKAFSIAACSDGVDREGEARARPPAPGAPPPATSRPRLLTMTRRKPSLPISSRLYSDSMPAWPTSEPGARPLYSGELQLALRDLAHPAERVRGGRGERVRAQRHHLHADLRQLAPPRLERRHVREGRVGLHHHRAGRAGGARAARGSPPLPRRASARAGRRGGRGPRRARGRARR